jgi:hypothetical protein
MGTTDQHRLPAFLLVDAHVHVHPCFARDDFLDAALRNFRQAAERLGLAGPYTGCLLLAEMKAEHWFRRARAEEAASPDTATWQLVPTQEEVSLFALRRTGEKLLLVAGRQIAAREGLEVLALGRDLEVPDGLPLDETLRRVRESGALAVLPWGFGKWWGRRGALVAGALARRNGEELFLGESSCRPDAGGMPDLFRDARAREVRVLPGTDPLPFPDHCGRAGSYGFVMEGPLDEDRPAEDLLGKIRRLRGQPRIYGRRATLSRFVRDQLAMQWRRRKPLAAVAAVPPQTPQVSP